MSEARPMKLDLNSLDMVTVLRVGAGLLVAAGVFTAIYILDKDFSDAFWLALAALTLAVSFAALIYLCAERLAGGDAALEQLAMIAGGALVAVIIILAIKAGTGDNASILWDTLRQIVSATPIGLPVLLFLSSRRQPDRALGRPDQNGMYVAVAILVIAILVAIKNTSDANYEEIWTLLGSLAVPCALGLILLGFTLGGPMPASVTVPEAKLRDWIFFGAIAVWIIGVLLAIHALDDSSSNGFWYFLRTLGSYLGVGICVVLASGSRHPRIDVVRPYLRNAALAAIALAFVGGLILTLDLNSDMFLLFWGTAITPTAFGFLALGIYEVSQASGRGSRASEATSATP